MNDDGPDPLDEAFAAYLRARDAGEPTTRDEFLGRFPDLATQLQELLDAADLMDQFASGVEDDLERPLSAAAWGGETAAGVELAETIDHVAGARDPDATSAREWTTDDDAGIRLPYHFGEYRLEGVLGRGGMGVVYLARQLHLERRVAVKMIRSGQLAEADEVRRFYAEARAVAGLQHPNIVTVYHCGRHEGRHFFSMDYVAGTDLARRLGDGPLAPREAARYVRDVARAIHYAHRQGVLHRDLKPANVLLDADDNVRVTDFGLAKQIDAESSLTRSGTAVGTPSYMAPEQARGDNDRLTPASDVYSMGAILFALLAGQPPFTGKNAVDLMMRVMHRPAPPVRSVRADVPVDLETIVAKCLEKSPRRRYASAEALADDLDRFLEDRPIAARRRSRIERGWHWIQSVPVVAALSGRRVHEATPAHRRLQTVLLAGAILAPLLLAASLPVLQWWHNRLPNVITITSGPPEGTYAALAEALAGRLSRATDREVRTIASAGSMENRRRLLDSDTDLAVLQASATDDDSIALVAPLYYESVHLLVRPDSGIGTVAEVRSRRVATGPDGGGALLAAALVLDSYGMDIEDIVVDHSPWSSLSDASDADAAIVVIAAGNAWIHSLLADRSWQLLAIDEASEIALQHPALRPIRIRPSDYPEADLPEQGVSTVATFAVLATTVDAPDRLVRVALESLYESAPPVRGLIPRRQAAEWPGLALHPEARRYFAETGAEPEVERLGAP